ncbi:MAG: hypothetical protein GXY23_12400 [Myxococcales bacterium]|jgi:hypothetical protein|nr:hypothetical protein [Myxococcales bacterium]
MGAGSSALIWYGMCLGFVAFVVIVSTALIFYGQLVEAKKRRRAQAALPPGESPPDPSEPPGTGLDPKAGDR